MAEQHSHQVYNPPRARADWPVGLVLGAVTAVALFILMALAQIIGGLVPPKDEIEETLIAIQPPEIEEIEEEEPPEPEQEEIEPELEQEPPQISLDQLDVALNPGTGNLSPADFSMPQIGTSQADLGTKDFIDFSDLDSKPALIGQPRISFSSSLKRKYDGKYTAQLLIRIDETGRVISTEVQNDDFPRDLARVLEKEFMTVKFSPPTKNGRPVKAQLVQPIPLTI